MAAGNFLLDQAEIASGKDEFAFEIPLVEIPLTDMREDMAREYFGSARRTGADGAFPGKGVLGSNKSRFDKSQLFDQDREAGYKVGVEKCNILTFCLCVAQKDASSFAQARFVFEIAVSDI